MPSSSIAFEKSFYILRDTKPTSEMRSHPYSIDILITQAYHIDSNGNIRGQLNQDALQFTHHHHAKLMALVTNNAFDANIAHLFLSNKNAQDRSIQFLLSECKKFKLYGLQFDFEGVLASDRAALTSYFEQAYQVLHAHGFSVSYAVIPSVDNDNQTTYEKRRYQYWTGAYDLSALAKVSDFITIMTYDQHQDGTTPGPFASIKWMEAAIKYALHHVPREKISLGVPTYSGYWHLGSSNNNRRVAVQLEDINYKRVMDIARNNRIKFSWDNVNKIHYAVFQRDWMNEYLFIEDGRSFHSKVRLAKKYGLRGISVFAIGNEDPAIWHSPALHA